MSKKRRRRTRRQRREIEEAPEVEGGKFITRFAEATHRSLQMRSTGSAMPWLKKMKVEDLEELYELLELEEGEWSVASIVLPEAMCSWEQKIPPTLVTENPTEEEVKFFETARVELCNVVRMLLWEKKGWISWEEPEFVFGWTVEDQQHFLVNLTEEGKKAGVDKKLKEIGQVQQM